MFGAGCGTAGEQPERVNVILIDLDTFRGDRVGLYETFLRGAAAAEARTPHLDELAKSGLYFPNAFSQAPRTLQSQTSIITSRYPGQHDVGSELWALPDTVPTIARAFREAGYETSAFVDLGWVRAKYGFGSGFDLFDEQGGGLRAIVPRAVGWLEERRSRKPFFVWLHAYDTHSPYDPYCVGVERKATGLKFGTNPGYEGRLQPPQIQKILRERKRWASLPDSTRALMAASYDHAIGCSDEWVGELLAGLERLGLDDDTVIACVSDHGEAFLEHEMFFHISLHHEILRVPFFIVVPRAGGGEPKRADRGAERAGTASANAAENASVIDGRVVETIDLAPTLLDIAGVPIPGGFEGESLTRAGALRPAADWPAKAAFAESSPWDGKELWWSITTDTHHLIRSIATGARELYAWRDDPREAVEISGADSALTNRLDAMLSDWAAGTSASDKPGYKPERTDEPTPEELEQMRALGYVQ